MKKIVLVCDRCGKEFSISYAEEKRTVTICRLNYGFPGLGEQYDLCKECFNEFSGWWNRDSAVLSFDDVNKIISHLDCDDCEELRRLVEDEKGNNRTDHA